jgi:hypothetical protein
MKVLATIEKEGYAGCSTVRFKILDTGRIKIELVSDRGPTVEVQVDSTAIDHVSSVASVLLASRPRTIG